MSEIGEQWSPKIAPAKIAPTVARNIGSSADAGEVADPRRLQANGINNGSSNYIVVKELPMDTAMAPAVRNATVGRKAGEMLSPTCEIM